MQVVETVETVDVTLGRAVARVWRLSTRRGLGARTRASVQRLRGAVNAVVAVLGGPVTQPAQIAEGTLAEEVRDARDDLRATLRWSFDVLRAQELGAGHDRTVTERAAHDRRALDALLSLANLAFDELGAAGGEHARGHEEGQEGDDEEEDEGDRGGGASHGANVMPPDAKEVSR